MNVPSKCRSQGSALMNVSSKCLPQGAALMCLVSVGHKVLK